MSNDYCVTNFIQKDDRGVHLTVFDDTLNYTNPEEMFEEWLKNIQIGLGNCVFRNKFCILTIRMAIKAIQPIGIDSTETVIEIIRECFAKPETLRLDIITPHNTIFSWLFVLASDLNK